MRQAFVRQAFVRQAFVKGMGLCKAGSICRTAVNMNKIFTPALEAFLSAFPLRLGLALILGEGIPKRRKIEPIMTPSFASGRVMAYYHACETRTMRISVQLIRGKKPILSRPGGTVSFQLWRRRLSDTVLILADEL